MDIAIGIMFFAYLGGFYVWTWGCWICCAMVVTAPIGALACRSWAQRHGLDATRCARLGALYWACGFMPWVHFAYAITGRTAPRRVVWVVYAALCVAMVLGPVIAGFFWAANVARHEWLVMTPFMSLLALPTALVSLAVAKPLPARQQRVHTGHVVAALLGSLAMLTWLPHRLVGWGPTSPVW